MAHSGIGTVGSGQTRVGAETLRRRTAGPRLGRRYHQSPIPPTVPSSGVVATVLLILVNVTDDQKSRDCEAAADHEGYQGAERDQAVKFCEDFSGPARVSPRETVLVPVPAPRHREPYDRPGVRYAIPSDAGTRNATTADRKMTRNSETRWCAMVVALGLVISAIAGCGGGSYVRPHKAALTDAEQQFLDAMDGPRVQMLSRESASDILAVGHAMCDALAGGATSNQAAQQVKATHSMNSVHDLATVATYAPKYLCPELRHQ
jgi:Protein of unknown function (DUF732)